MPVSGEVHKYQWKMNETHKIRVNILFNLLLYVLVSTSIYKRILI